MNSSARLSLGVLTSERHLSHVDADEVLAGRADASSFGLLYERHLVSVFRYLSRGCLDAKMPRI